MRACTWSTAASSPPVPPCSHEPVHLSEWARSRRCRLRLFLPCADLKNKTTNTHTDTHKKYRKMHAVERGGTCFREHRRQRRTRHSKTNPRTHARTQMSVCCVSNQSPREKSGGTTGPAEDRRAKQKEKGRTELSPIRDPRENAMVRPPSRPTDSAQKRIKRLKAHATERATAVLLYLVHVSERGYGNRPPTRC